MPDSLLPLILEPSDLQAHLNDDNLLIVDLSAVTTYEAYHIPGAVHLDYSHIIGELPDAPGPLPDNLALTQALVEIGLTKDTHVIAYDDGDSLQACRLLWTLDLIGHQNYSLLNGGLNAWLDERHPVEKETVTPTPSANQFELVDNPPMVHLLYLLQHLNDEDLSIVDARTPEEYCGKDLRAQRGGHIPGAINLDYRLLIDPDHSLRLRSESELRSIVEKAGIDKNKQLICHCQSHRRSALVYIALKSLGFTKLKAYPGSWAEWGNNLDTPIE